MPQRQEVLNVILAQLLEERGLIAAPEQIIAGVGRRDMPDIIVDFRGLRLQIECEFAGRTPRQARSKAFAKAKERVEEAMAHIGVAVVYPSRLREERFDKVKRLLASSTLEYAIITEAIIVRPGDQFRLFAAEPEPSFSEGTIDDLGDALRRCYEQLIRDETLDRAVELIESRIGDFIGAVSMQSATAVRMARVLGVEDLPSDARALTPRQQRAVGRIAALIIANAMIFHEVLAKHEPRVKTLQSFHSSDKLVGAFREHWEFILDQINYYPIFFTAERLLESLSADERLERMLASLRDAALVIVSWRASLRHDLAGRIYHRLLEDSKYLGAYYTSIPSATLLLKLALQPGLYSTEWSSPDAITDLRIADLACGTGTLLMAAADSVIDNHVRVSATNAIRPRSSTVNRNLASDVLFGYDVLPSAIHLTASTLSLRVPETTLDRMNLYRVLHGGERLYLGTLDAIDPAGARGTLFAQPERVGGRGTERIVDLVLPRLDLCVMNPPFTSSRKGNRLFGSLPDSQRRPMQTRLRRLVRQQGLSASVTAGLGSVFVALGDRQLKPGGRLALVLPKAILSGISWTPTRRLIEAGYVLESVIASHEVGRWNFSENTNITETMLVAKKDGGRGGRASDLVTFVNLWRQPRTAVESLNLAHLLTSSNIPPLGDGAGVAQLIVNDRKYGEAFTIPWQHLQGRSWALPTAFSQAALVSTFMELLDGRLIMPGGNARRAVEVPLTPLGSFARIGPDPRDVWDGFSLSYDDRTDYPSIWGHDPDAIRTMAAAPNKYLRPRSEALPGRPLRNYRLLWPRAGRVLVAMRIRLNTKKLVAVRTQHRVLSDVWWPITLNAGDPDRHDLEKCFVLWLNSTLGVLLLLGLREETQGAWVQYKKPHWEGMPVLDVSRIGDKTRTELVAAYDRLRNDDLNILPSLASDPVRAEIDASISGALGLPDMAPLRAAVSMEPIFRQDMDGLIIPEQPEPDIDACAVIDQADGADIDL